MHVCIWPKYKWLFLPSGTPNFTVRIIVSDINFADLFLKYS